MRRGSDQTERHRRSSAAVRSRSDASESATRAQLSKPRRSSDCTTDDADSMSGDRAPLSDDIYGRRPDDRDFYDYKVSQRAAFVNF